jgi:DNA-binding transcriptional regulator YhcF (GntR family)
MDFKNNQSIYLQIANHFYQGILQEEWEEDDKIPSVRALAVDMEVNPNTVMRSYTKLQEQGVIYNKRGLGNFIAKGAKGIVARQLRQDFLQADLPELFKTMQVLGMEVKDLEEFYSKWKSENR